MDLGIGGKVAMVTRASRGIGRAIALGLVAEGARVVMCARNAADLDAAVREARARSGGETAAVGVTTDVTTPAGVVALVDAAVAAYGGIDVVVNNAGGSGARDFAGHRRGRPAGGPRAQPVPGAARVARRAPAPHGARRRRHRHHRIGLRPRVGRRPQLQRRQGRRDQPGQGDGARPRQGRHPRGQRRAPVRRQKADPEGIAAFVKREIPNGGSGDRRRSRTW
jgi:3-oxoacyl-[acyl-carrier protein] reductase